MSAGDFAGLGFAIGTVKGVRAWDVDKLGRLRAVYKTDAIWKPGENVAKCRYNHKETDKYTRYPMTDCACGFYAFYKDNNEYASKHRISGVIEGYGQTVIGTKGFRAEKAKIVALHIPRPKVVAFQWPLVGWLRKQGSAGFIGPMALAMALFALIPGVGLLFSPEAFGWGILLLGVAAVLGYVFAAAIRADFGPDKDTYNEVLTADLLGRVIHNYPDVELFDSYKEMIAKYPPDKGEPPLEELTPEKVKDFWELDAEVLGQGY
jgi:hypothetical protein